VHGDAIAINSGTAAYFIGQYCIYNVDKSFEEKVEIYNCYFEAMRASHSGQAMDIYGLDYMMPDAMADDKVAKLLDFDYPGGPHISKLARAGTTEAIQFPRPMLNQDNFDFSFAGLKTSALYWLQKNNLTEKITVADFCASFEQAIIDVLITKTLRAAEKHHPKTIILAGGVSANEKLRTTLQREVRNNFSTTPVLLSAPGYSMDNAAMIAVAGYYKTVKKQFTPWQKLAVNPNWKVDQPFECRQTS
jgi:tRNA A37 threonylcarbamoyltransferase TsaD